MFHSSLLHLIIVERKTVFLKSHVSLLLLEYLLLQLFKLIFFIIIIIIIIIIIKPLLLHCLAMFFMFCTGIIK